MHRVASDPGSHSRSIKSRVLRAEEPVDITYTQTNRCAPNAAPLWHHHEIFTITLKKEQEIHGIHQHRLIDKNMPAKYSLPWTATAESTSLQRLVRQIGQTKHPESNSVSQYQLKTDKEGHHNKIWLVKNPHYKSRHNALLL